MSVTMRDVAKRAETSPGVVSVALNGAKSKTVRLSEETRQRVLNAAEELGYKRDPRASALASGKNRVIGLMLLHSDSFTAPDPFSSIVAAGVAAGASRTGYNLMLYTAVAEEEGERAAKRIDRQIDGLVLVVPPQNSPIFDECSRLDIPVVSILLPQSNSYSTINVQDREGVQMLMKHLFELGHRRIAHVLGAPGIHTTPVRFQAYKDSLEEAGLEFSPDWVLEGNFLREDSYQATLALLDQPEEVRPTAIFAANDLSAHGAIEAIKEKGLRVPEDISVVGFDGTWYASIIDPPLTTIDIGCDQLGRAAVDLLIQEMEGEGEIGNVSLPVRLIVRKSTGPAPAEASIPSIAP